MILQTEKKSTQSIPFHHQCTYNFFVILFFYFYLIWKQENKREKNPVSFLIFFLVTGRKWCQRDNPKKIKRSWNRYWWRGSIPNLGKDVSSTKLRVSLMLPQQLPAVCNSDNGMARHSNSDQIHGSWRFDPIGRLNWKRRLHSFCVPL